MLDTVAIVESNQILAPTFGRLVLRIDKRINFLAGQFVMVKPTAILEPILRRALAVYKVIDDGTSIELLYQVFGRGLDQLMKARQGDHIDCLGPLGTGFSIPEDNSNEVLLVAGGIGSAALFMLAEDLLTAGRSVNLFFGAASKATLIGIEDFQQLGIEITVSTDDGTAGFHGRVTEPLETYLSQNPRSKPVIYTCGPYPMMRRVAEIAEAADLKAFVSLETRMACGFGVCVGCVHPIKTGCDGQFTYQRVCIEGPVFNSADVVW